MPPVKPVDSLHTLALAASSKFIHSSSKLLSSNDTSECKDVHNHVIRLIPPAILEPVFECVMDLQEEAPEANESVLYSIFVHEEMQMEKLKVGYEHDDSDVAIALRSRQVETWLLQHLPLCTNLVEVDVTMAQCNIIPAICKSIVNLQVVTLPVDAPPGLMEKVFRSCKKLRKINCARCQPLDVVRLALEVLDNLESISCPIDGALIGSLDPHRQLKLRSLYLIGHITAENVQMAFHLCPELEKLAIKVPAGTPSESRDASIFLTLATSVLKVSRLRLVGLDVSSVSFQRFCTFKGDHIKKLEILTDKTSNGILIDIARACQNLQKLEVSIPEVCNLGSDVSLHFPNLQHLDVDDWYKFPDLSTAIRCLSNAPQLTTFSLWLYRKWCETLVYELYELFSVDQVKKLTNVQLYADKMELSRPLVEYIYNNCTAMKRLAIGKLTKDAKQFLEEKIREAKEMNLNFTFVSI